MEKLIAFLPTAICMLLSYVIWFVVAEDIFTNYRKIKKINAKIKEEFVSGKKNLVDVEIVKEEVNEVWSIIRIRIVLILFGIALILKISNIV